MRKFVLLLIDIALLYASLAITIYFRYGELSPSLWQRHLLPFSIVFLIWIILFFINGLYDFRKVGENLYGKLVQNLIIGGLLAIAVFYLFQGQITTLRPQTVLVILLVIFAILFILWRKLFFALISSARLGSNLAIIGISPESLMLAQEIITNPQLSYQLKLIVNPDHSPIPEKFQVVKITSDIADIKKQLIENKINTVVTLMNPKYSPEVARYLFESIDLKIQFYNLTDFFEKITGRIPLSTLERNWFLQNITQKNNQWYAFIKRLIDIVFSIIFGIIGLVLTPIIVLLIRFDSPGKIIYKQDRVGKNNKVFKVYKFRTMVQNAESNGAVWAQANDSRVTKIGKFLRKTRMDEIPQFINILIGNMSFVGPRPERPEFVEQLKNEIPYYNERHLIKPGLTGWAQINFPYGASVEDAKQKLQYDLYYIKNQSVATDISIIFKTLNTIFNLTLGR